MDELRNTETKETFPMTPDEILKGIYQRAAMTMHSTVIPDPFIRGRVD